ncbi:MAG TPA: 6-bladed beta-propeller [Rudaea sp.]
MSAMRLSYRACGAFFLAAWSFAAFARPSSVDVVQGAGGGVTEWAATANEVVAVTAFASSGYRSVHFENSIGGFTFPFQVTTDNDMVYISDATANVIQVYRITAAGISFVRTIGSSGSGAGQFNGPEQVAVVGNYLYIADFSNNRVQRFDKTTGAYVSQFGSFGSGAGQFSTPSGLVYNPINGNLYVSDLGNDRVQIFSTSGTYLSQFGSPGAGNGQLNNPYVLAVDGRGNIYAADSNNNRIVKFDATGAFLRNIAIGATTPYGVAVDSADKVWVATGDNNIYAYDTTGTYRSYYYGNLTATPAPNGYLGGVRGIAVTPPLNVPPYNGAPVVVIADGSSGVVQTFTQSAQPIAHPLIRNLAGLSGFIGGVAYDSAENVYVTAYFSNQVFKFDKFGNYLLQWGSSGTGNGQFSSPYGIAIDDSDNVYVADSSNNRIQKFTANGAYLLQWGSAGNGNGQFSSPGSIATDGSWIYVSDEVNDRVQKFSFSGGYVRQWGSAGTGNGQMQNPAGIAVDRKRNQVYVAEYGNSRVQQFTVFGDFIKVIADSTSGTGQLSNPVGMAIDQHGNVYVADRGNNRVVHYNDNGTYLSNFASASANAMAANPHNAQLHVGSSSGAVTQFGAVMGKSDTVGVYRSSNQTFYLRNSLAAGAADITAAVVGASNTDLPIVGDWNGDGVDTAGLYRPSTSTFYLWDRWTNLNIASADYSFVFGSANDLPMAGDWNGEGRDSVGVFHPATGIHHLKNDLIAGSDDYGVVFGTAGDKPVAGDWNQDGAGSVAFYRPGDGRLHATNRNINGSALEELSYGLGNSTDLPVVGDWTHSGYAGFGVFRPSTATFSIDTQDRAPDSMFRSGFEPPLTFAFGASGDLPVVGVWGQMAE